MYRLQSMALYIGWVVHHFLSTYTMFLCYLSATCMTNVFNVYVKHDEAQVRVSSVAPEYDELMGQKVHIVRDTV